MLETQSYRYLTIASQDGLTHLGLARPEKRNALSLDVMRELTAALRAIGGDKDSRAVILSGEGPAFSAGHDLSELVAGDVERYRAVFDACVELMETVQTIPQPVIAEVASVATAAGCQLVAACDLAVAGMSARFATPGVKIGLFCSTPMVALTRAIGRKRAMQMLLTGDFIDAQTAADWGLVNVVVPDDALAEATLALARRIVAASRFVVGLGKSAFYAQIDLSQEKAYAYAKEVMSMNALAEDAQEGMRAFLEKRAPKWK
ncbi:MAG: enoyl-CoA hydratase [Candidatus Eremiobacteraeota bacterium]|nr:enoyl-CoA hydratase [Candidatus Eremiobacteraeota bacterium]